MVRPISCLKVLITLTNSDSGSQGYTCVSLVVQSQTRSSVNSEHSPSTLLMSARFWYMERVDADKHPLGTCSGCQLHWGHTGPCAIDFTSNKPSSRRAAIAAISSMKLKKRKFKNEPRALDTESVEQPTQPEVDVEVEDDGIEKEEVIEVDVKVEDDRIEEEEVIEVLEGTVVNTAVPTIQQFMTISRLEPYLDAMIDNGWDDVQYLHKIVKKIEDFSKLDSFPIYKHGHRMKFLMFLQQIVQPEPKPVDVMEVVKEEGPPEDTEEKAIVVKKELVVDEGVPPMPEGAVVKEERMD